MSNQAFGIAVILLSFLGYFYSFKNYKKENLSIAILLLCVSGLLIRFFVASDFYLHPWDERYHALVAKNLIHHPFTPTLYGNPVLPYYLEDWTSNHIWLHKQPLPLWTMAVSMWVLGINEIALRLPSILLSTIGIWLTFSIGKYLFNHKTGFLAAFFYSINGLIVELTGGRVATDHIDIFFLFFIELAIFLSIQFVIKKNTLYNVFAGIAIGAAVLTKWLPALIVLPVWLLIVIDSKKFNPKTIALQFFVLTGVSILIFLPLQIYIHQRFPMEAAWETNFNMKHLTETLSDRSGPFYYYVDKLRINYGELIYLPLLWFFFMSIKQWGNLKRLSICIWILLPVIFFSAAATKMQGYILFLAPALFIITADFWYVIHNKWKDAKKNRWLYISILFLLIALPIRYSIERLKPFENRIRNREWVYDLKKLNNKEYDGKGLLFNYSRPIEAMFYTSLTAYPDIPDRNVLDDLQARGYKIIMNDNGKLPAETKSLEKIEYVKLSDPKN